MSNEKPWAACTNVLCLRPDNLGDVIMTGPALRALKEAVPGRRITLLTSRAGAQIVPLMPEIDDCIQFEVPWVQTQREGSVRATEELITILRERQFDGAVLFTTFSQSVLPTALICYLAGIPKRLGYCRENPYQLLTDWIPDYDRGEIHEVERQLTLVATIGARTLNTKLSLSVPEEASLTVRTLLQSRKIQKGRWCILHPGVSEMKRQYSLAEIAQATKTLADRESLTVVVTGRKSEWELAEKVCQDVGRRAINLAGSLEIDELAALIAEAPLLISNNTGPVHIAAAVGTPVVVLYALTNPQHTPWQVPHSVLYFPVPPALQSRNVMLQEFPKSWAYFYKPASYQAIVSSATELLHQSGSLTSKYYGTGHHTHSHL